MDFKEKVNECITGFIGEFMKRPNHFIGESDVVSYFFKNLYAKTREGEPNDNVSLLHTEYPTPGKVKGKDSKGHFDLAILDDTKNDPTYTKNRINVAMEFKVNTNGKWDDKLKKKIEYDLNKMEDFEIDHKYFIFVVKNREYDYERFDLKEHSFLGTEKTRFKKTNAIINLMKKYSKVNCYYIEHDTLWDTAKITELNSKKPSSTNSEPECYDEYHLETNVFVFKNKKHTPTHHGAAEETA